MWRKTFFVLVPLWAGPAAAQLDAPAPFAAQAIDPGFQFRPQLTPRLADPAFQAVNPLRPALIAPAEPRLDFTRPGIGDLAQPALPVVPERETLSPAAGGLILRSLTTPAGVVADPGAYLRDVTPAEADLRLNVEGLSLSTAEIRDLLVAPADAAVATTRLRSAITDTGGRLGTVPIVSGLATDPHHIFAGAVSAPAVPVDALPAFQENVRRSLLEETARPGILRIFNGLRITEPDPFQEAVMIVDAVAGEIRACSGVLVSADYVLSAAHCLCFANQPRALFGATVLLTRYTINVEVGASVSYVPCDAMRDTGAIGSVIRNGDLALLRLAQPVPDIPVRRLASPEMVERAAQIRAVGWGATEGAGAYPGKFAVDIAIASYDCSDLPAEADRDYGCRATHELLAAGFGRDTCSGDSGGPAYVLDQVEIQLFVAAITSRSYSATGACGDGGIYVKLTDPDIQDWLRGYLPASSFAVASQ